MTFISQARDKNNALHRIYARIIETTWSELSQLKNNAGLKPGAVYRITDYTCTTTQADTQSAGHVFDIIVRADSVDRLNENAWAAHHAGDTYFQYSKLEAWELKYCIDNDTDRFAWADSTNGKGVIFYMKDEFGNECGYDFKNIMMKFYKITAVTTVPSSLNNTYSVSKVIGENNYTITSGCTVDENQYEFRYTFDFYSNSAHSDYSLNTASSNKAKFCYDNVITPMYAFTFADNTENNKKMWINFISFRNILNNSSCYGNKFGAMNYNISFGNNCFYNTFGNGCYSNTFRDNCCYNTFGTICYYNTFGTVCSFNTFGNYCQFNTFGDACSFNTFGGYCNFNTFGIMCNSNTLGNNCQYIKFGNSSSVKSFYQNIIVENGNQYIYLETTQTTSDYNKIQNVKIALGMNNTMTYKTISHNTVNDTFQTVYQPANSQTISV